MEDKMRKKEDYCNEVENLSRKIIIDISKPWWPLETQYREMMSKGKKPSTREEPTEEGN